MNSAVATMKPTISGTASADSLLRILRVDHDAACWCQNAHPWPHHEAERDDAKTMLRGLCCLQLTVVSRRLHRRILHFKYQPHQAGQRGCEAPTRLVPRRRGGVNSQGFSGFSGFSGYNVHGANH